MGANAKQGMYLGTTLVGFTSFVAGLHSGGGLGIVFAIVGAGLAVCIGGRLLQDQSGIDQKPSQEGNDHEARWSFAGSFRMVASGCRAEHDIVHRGQDVPVHPGNRHHAGRDSECAEQGPSERSCLETVVQSGSSAARRNTLRHRGRGDHQARVQPHEETRNETLHLVETISVGSDSRAARMWSAGVGPGASRCAQRSRCCLLHLRPLAVDAPLDVSGPSADDQAAGDPSGTKTGTVE